MVCVHTKRRKHHLTPSCRIVSFCALHSNSAIFSLQKTLPSLACSAPAPPLASEHKATGAIIENCAPSSPITPAPSPYRDCALPRFCTQKRLPSSLNQSASKHSLPLRRPLPCAPPTRQYALNHRHEHQERKTQPELCGLCALCGGMIIYRSIQLISSRKHRNP